MNKEHDNTDGRKYLFDDAKNVRRVVLGLVIVCVALFVGDFLVHRHISHVAERLWGFYAIYGFVACVVLVLLATQMRRILMREEDYYDRD